MCYEFLELVPVLLFSAEPVNEKLQALIPFLMMDSPKHIDIIRIDWSIFKLYH